MTAHERRESVYYACRGCCVGCGMLQRLRAPAVFGWDTHHVVRAQHLRREKVPKHVIDGPSLCVVLCAKCHSAQTSAMGRVPLEMIPAPVVSAVRELGSWAEDLLRREHPPLTEVSR
jgi:hypothetical protein